MNLLISIWKKKLFDFCAVVYSCESICSKRLRTNLFFIFIILRNRYLYNYIKMESSNWNTFVAYLKAKSCRALKKKCKSIEIQALIMTKETLKLCNKWLLTDAYLWINYWLISDVMAVWLKPEYLIFNSKKLPKCYYFLYTYKY